MTKHLQKISKYKPSRLQGALQFEAARPRTGLAVEHPYERRALSVLLMLLCAFVAVYLYFVTASILHVMHRSEALSQAEDIQTSTAALEEKYFALSQEVSPQAGQALGLSQITTTSYVYRPGNAAVADARTSAI